jgi:hypothetical protein
MNYGLDENLVLKIKNRKSKIVIRKFLCKLTY